MARSLHVRLDEASAAALDVVRAGGMTDSEAVRTALREAAARRRVRSAIRDEVRRLAGDENDREEMRVIREQMAELAPHDHTRGTRDASPRRADHRRRPATPRRIGGTPRRERVARRR